ncbi:hypothetical protein I7I53_01803 [Histoplasma capsulatum var. duboisii H88]|uniref:Uncharacterized protein n=1 Tax=Ajellomyces capsulatus (strain H88) TaxID=544711 RepID=A0A8A1LLF8_AJEC8|nr:hypothetical protein I7I53_01803 [Histoplasma capsulatum var. duboisii H88]
MVPRFWGQTRNSSGNREYEPEREGYASILSGRLDGRARKGQKGMYLLIQLIIQKFGHFKYWQILASPHFSFDFKELYIITVVRLHQSTRAHVLYMLLGSQQHAIFFFFFFGEGGRPGFGK